MTDWESIDAGLTGPNFFVGDEFHDAFTVLRAEEPVHWTVDRDADRAFWSLTRYEDCLAVLSDPLLFSSRDGGVLPAKGPKASAELRHKIGADVRLVHQDPPFHTQVRRPLNPLFSVPSIKRYKERFEKIVDDLIDEITDAGNVDLVDVLCTPIPVRVVLDLMDVPRDDWDQLCDYAAAIINPGDPEIANGRDPQTVQVDGFVGLNAYMHADLMRRRKNPGQDLPSKIAVLEVEGEQLSERYIGWMGSTIVAAGLESTRDAGSLGLQAFIRNPDQAELLRKNPGLAGSAVQEVLRLATPSPNRFRIATADTEIGGQKIKTDDWVVSWLHAANRDPAVFDRPHEFDITRDPNPHLSFGIGTHMCLGRNAARIELERLFVRFVQRFPDAAEVGPGSEWIGHTNTVTGLRSYRVDLGKPVLDSPLPA